ncbi:MAG: acyl-CoA dehydrogenase [Candidatus Hydrogenedentota bacterium]|nr:MAG: acyl-CoA dehydrogenase [Candidatus Hydrogenedentota bacterium]
MNVMDFLPKEVFQVLGSIPDPIGKSLVRFIDEISEYVPTNSWQRDTNTLPKELAKYRREVREFAESKLKPFRDEGDRGLSVQSRDAILRLAAKEGLFSDMLPIPFGTVPWQRYRYPFHLCAAIKMEELCATCGGIGLLIGAHSLGLAPLILSADWNIFKEVILPLQEANMRGVPKLAAYAITEPGAGSDAEDSEGAQKAKPGLKAKRVRGGWLLNGRKVFISGGDIASVVSTFAAIDEDPREIPNSWTCFAVDTSSCGFSCGRNEKKMGQKASSATELIFEDVFVPDSRVVGGLRNGWKLNQKTLNYSRIPVGAIAIGIARGALEDTLEYCKKSGLMNKQIIAFKLAQMESKLMAGRSMIWYYAKDWTAQKAIASAVKVICSDIAMEVCETCMDILGNESFLANRVAEKAMRDVRLTQIYEGTNQINLLAVFEESLAK